jgi:hypothetical protein
VSAPTASESGVPNSAFVSLSLPLL